jgi:hypothetical protein
MNTRFWDADLTDAAWACVGSALPGRDLFSPKARVLKRTSIFRAPDSRNDAVLGRLACRQRGPLREQQSFAAFLCSTYPEMRSAVETYARRITVKDLKRRTFTWRSRAYSTNRRALIGVSAR